MNRLLCSLAAMMLWATASHAAGLHGADLGLSTRKVDFHVRRAEVSRMLEVLSHFEKRNVVVDSCVKGAIDLTIKNAPLPIVFDALASQAGLEYQLDGDTIRVHCAGGAGSSAAAAPPVNVRVRGELRLALSQAFPKATQAEIDQAVSSLEKQLRHD